MSLWSMFENRQIAVVKGQCRRFWNSCECLRLNVPRIIGQFGRKRCQKKRKVLGYQSIRVFVKTFCFIWTAGAVKNSFIACVCYTPDGLFWKVLYVLKAPKGPLKGQKQDQWHSIFLCTPLFNGVKSLCIVDFLAGCLLQTLFDSLQGLGRKSYQRTLKPLWFTNNSGETHLTAAGLKLRSSRSESNRRLRATCTKTAAHTWHADAIWKLLLFWPMVARRRRLESDLDERSFRHLFCCYQITTKTYGWIWNSYPYKYALKWALRDQNTLLCEATKFSRIFLTPL